MICAKCQDVLNLDILLSTHQNYPGNEGQPQPHKHYESFAAMEESARAGCQLCILACSVQKGSYLAECRQLEHADAEISWELAPHDILHFETAVRRRHMGSYGTRFRGLALSPVEGDRITTLLNSAFTTRPLANDIGSEACFELASYWLRTCEKQHGPECRLTLAGLPTRVLDVGSLENSICKLYCPGSQQPGQWITLSHCWGGKVPMTTTLENFEARCKGMALNEMPQTFQDAVIITRKLGYRYLWIDSLCIIQDSVVDWQTQSVKMAGIYSNAVLNISADASSNAYEGIFRPANGRTLDGTQKVFTNRPKLQQVTLYSPRHKIWSRVHVRPRNGDVPIDVASVLQERGWVFQEAGLSRRRLRYTTDGLRWSCRAVDEACHEYHPHEIRSTDPGISQYSSIYDIPIRMPTEHVSYEICISHYDQKDILWWYEQVGDFIGRTLTYPTDRFPALSGLTQQFQTRTGYRYVAGIWLEDFRRGLLWTTYGANINRNHAPSWSWAAIIGVPKTENQKCGIYNTWMSFKYLECHKVEYVHHTVTTEADAQFGRVLSAKICLRGQCKNLFQLRDSRAFFFESGASNLEGKSYVSKDTPNAWKNLRLSIDMMENDSIESFFERKDIIFLQIARFTTGQYAEDGADEPHPDFKPMYALVLEPAGGDGKLYRRVGVARMPLWGEEDGRGWDVKEFTIV